MAMHARMHTVNVALAVGLGFGVSALGAAVQPASGATIATGPLTHTNSAPNPILGFPESWGLTRHDVVLIAAGLLIALLLFAVLFLRVRRRRRAAVSRVEQAPPRVFPQSAESWRGTGMIAEPTGPLPRFAPGMVVLSRPETGWHPVDGDPTRIAYWDGTCWAAVRLWDGQQWVEPTASTA